MMKGNEDVITLNNFKFEDYILAVDSICNSTPVESKTSDDSSLTKPHDADKTPDDSSLTKPHDADKISKSDTLISEGKRKRKMCGRKTATYKSKHKKFSVDSNKKDLCHNIKTSRGHTYKLGIKRNGQATQSENKLALPLTMKERNEDAFTLNNNMYEDFIMAVDSICNSTPVESKTSDDSSLTKPHDADKTPDDSSLTKSHDADETSKSSTLISERKEKRKMCGRKTATYKSKHEKFRIDSNKKDLCHNIRTSRGHKYKLRINRNGQATQSENKLGKKVFHKKLQNQPRTSSQCDHFIEPSAEKLVDTSITFLQDGPCFKVAPKLVKCRECTKLSNQHSHQVSNALCRFHGFRRLRYKTNGQLAISGFSDPVTDASEDDISFWLPPPADKPTTMDVEVSKFILTQMGDQFCTLVQQEKEAIAIDLSNDKTVAWKKLIEGVREMCDVCETTLFNFHWTCRKCGFVVCIDCYKDHKNRKKTCCERQKNCHNLSWLLCTGKQPHKLAELMLTQIIAGSALLTLSSKLHQVRATWGLQMNCGCPLASQVRSTRKADVPIRDVCFKKKKRFWPTRTMTVDESKTLYPDVPHSWLCNGKLLQLMDPVTFDNYKIFYDQWKRGQPVIVSNVTKQMNMDLWHPESFARDFGNNKIDLINCITGNLVPSQSMRRFWEGFENFSKRLTDKKGKPMLLKLKDWPPGQDFAELLPSRFKEVMKALPLDMYTQRSGRVNLPFYLPKDFVHPDLGPKMYTAYGSALYATKGTTNLHIDISDAVNVMIYIGLPKASGSDNYIQKVLKTIDEADCDILTRRRVYENGELPGALWHIYTAGDADKIRDFLKKVTLGRGNPLKPHHDPIHDQNWYLDRHLRQRLHREYGVEGYTIVQCFGDAIFIPAGAPHQVQNLHSCIKVAEDFVSPEHVHHCLHLTQEFRNLTKKHTNREDKLQIKNIIYHTVKDALSALDVRYTTEGDTVVIED